MDLKMLSRVSDSSGSEKKDALREKIVSLHKTVKSYEKAIENAKKSISELSETGEDFNTLHTFVVGASKRLSALNTELQKAREELVGKKVEDSDDPDDSETSDSDESDDSNDNLDNVDDSTDSDRKESLKKKLETLEKQRGYNLAGIKNFEANIPRYKDGGALQRLHAGIRIFKGNIKKIDKKIIEVKAMINKIKDSDDAGSYVKPVLGKTVSVIVPDGTTKKVKVVSSVFKEPNDPEDVEYFFGKLGNGKVDLFYASEDDDIMALAHDWKEEGTYSDELKKAAKQAGVAVPSESD